MKIDKILVQEGWWKIEEYDDQGVLMNWMYWVDMDWTQWVLNVEDSIENCSENHTKNIIKQCQRNHV